MNPRFIARDIGSWLPTLRIVRLVTFAIAVILLSSEYTPRVVAQIVTRNQEPIVMDAGSFPAFTGIPVNRIRLYTKVSETWVEIPSQVDERIVDTLDTYYVPGDPCKLSAATCELAVKVTGDPGNFGSFAQVVFMARDGAGQLAATTDWVGTPTVDTMSTRYLITVADGVNGQTGIVYAYAWLKEPSHLNDVASYVSWTPDTSNPSCIVTSPLELPRFDAHQV